jgi:cysteine desulfurase / selenocysteine lyase
VPDDIDVARARVETPGCQDRIHLNNAGASLMPRPVLETVKAHLDYEAVRGGYEAGAENADRHAAVYRSVAKLIGAEASEIALFENATTAWDLGFHGAVLGMELGAGDIVLTTVAEYCSNHTGLIQLSKRYGFEVEVVPDDEHGQVSVEALEARLGKGDVRLMSLVHMPTNGGLINPAEAVGAMTRAAGIPLMVGQVAIDVERIGCDMLVAPGRKFLRGPRGTGFLYVRSAFMDKVEPLLFNMRATIPVAVDQYEATLPGAAQYETWEGSFALQLGLGAAIDYAMDWGLEAIAARVQALAAGLRDRLAEIDGMIVRDKGVLKGGIVTASLEDKDPADISQALAQQNINLNYSPTFMSFFDTQQRSLPPLLRASVHYYNTDEELDTVAEALARLLH